MKAYILAHLLCGDCSHTLATDLDTGIPNTYRVACYNPACKNYQHEHLWEAPEAILKEAP